MKEAAPHYWGKEGNGRPSAPDLFLPSRQYLSLGERQKNDKYPPLIQYEVKSGYHWDRARKTLHWTQRQSSLLLWNTYLYRLFKFMVLSQLPLKRHSHFWLSIGMRQNLLQLRVQAVERVSRSVWVQKTLLIGGSGCFLRKVKCWENPRYETQGNRACFKLCW